MPDAASLPFAELPLAELLARCRAYEPAAQWALYARFAGPMLLVAQRYAPALADAEDVLQDAFIKVFQQLPTQREPEAFPGWVRRIVITTALDAWHKRRVRRTDFTLDDAHHLPAPDASALDQLSVEEVKAHIEQLPAGCKLVLLLYTVEGYAHAEIAALLGIGESASKAQLTRARQRLTALVREAARERAPAPLPGFRPAAASAEWNPEPAARPAPPLEGPSAAPFHPLTALLFQ